MKPLFIVLICSMLGACKPSMVVQICDSGHTQVITKPCFGRGCPVEGYNTETVDICDKFHDQLVNQK